MITKTTEPLLNDKGKVIGTQVEYRLFGILIMKKVLYKPEKYGIEFYDDYFTLI